MSAQGCIELSTRDLYCIQTIYDQEDVFKLLVSIYLSAQTTNRMELWHYVLSTKRGVVNEVPQLILIWLS